MIIGVDPHKSSHTATAVDPATNKPVASLRVVIVTGRLSTVAALGAAVHRSTLGRGRGSRAWPSSRAMARDSRGGRVGRAEQGDSAGA